MATIFNANINNNVNLENSTNYFNLYLNKSNIPKIK